MLVDDHPSVRRGLSDGFQTSPDMEICSQAGRISEANECLKAITPDAIVLDLNVNGESGLEWIKDLRAKNISIPILVLSVNDENIFAERCISAGARGYLCKTASVEEVIEAVRQMLAGEVAVSPHMSRKFIQRMTATFGSEKKSGTMMDAIKTLSDREIEIFQILGNGKSSKEIAATLKISPHTVDSHRRHIMEKMGFQNSQELIRQAILWVNDTKISS